MFLKLLLTVSTLAFSQTYEFYQVKRVEPHNNRAQVARSGSQDIAIGDQLKVDTPNGNCQVSVTEVYAEHFYIDTQQCARTDVVEGTFISSEMPQGSQQYAGDDPTLVPEEAFEADQQSTYTNDWMSSEFYQNYVADKLSTYISYHMSNSLQGDVNLGATGGTIEELSGANTIGFGAEYRIWQFPNRLSITGGLTYELPRSFGQAIVTNTNGQITQSFEKNPTLFAWNFYANLRYQIMDELQAFVGLNRLAANLKYLPGETNGDFGFHLGARWYPYTRFFAEGSLNFYNLDHTVAGNTTDLTLNEFELKGGYTF